MQELRHKTDVLGSHVHGLLIADMGEIVGFAVAGCEPTMAATGAIGAINTFEYRMIYRLQMDRRGRRSHRP